MKTMKLAKADGYEFDRRYLYLIENDLFEAGKFVPSLPRCLVGSPCRMFELFVCLFIFVALSWTDKTPDRKLVLGIMDDGKEEEENHDNKRAKESCHRDEFPIGTPSGILNEILDQLIYQGYDELSCEQGVIALSAVKLQQVQVKVNDIHKEAKRSSPVGPVGLVGDKPGDIRSKCITISVSIEELLKWLNDKFETHSDPITLKAVTIKWITRALEPLAVPIKIYNKIAKKEYDKLVMEAKSIQCTCGSCDIPVIHESAPPTPLVVTSNRIPVRIVNDPLFHLLSTMSLPWTSEDVWTHFAPILQARATASLEDWYRSTPSSMIDHSGGGYDLMLHSKSLVEEACDRSFARPLILTTESVIVN
jgi:hypothetical protein